MGAKTTGVEATVYAGRGFHISPDGKTAYIEKTIQRELALLKNPMTARIYLNRYSLLDRLCGNLGILPLPIQERYDTATATLRNIKEKDISSKV